MRSALRVFLLAFRPMLLLKPIFRLCVPVTYVADAEVCCRPASVRLSVSDPQIVQPSGRMQSAFLFRTVSVRCAPANHSGVPRSLISDRSREVLRQLNTAVACPTSSSHWLVGVIDHLPIAR